jgi:signal transduction histidine kinase
MLNKWAERSKPQLCAGIALVTLLIGYVNYVVEPNVAMSAFYLLPIAIAAWWVGLSFSLTIAVSSVALWLVGNLEHGGGLFKTLGHTAWNSGVRLTEYIVVAIAVNKLRNAQRELEARVQERTAELEKSQHDLVQNSEREQRRIGQDLHDGLCQHLAGTALICQALHDELAEKDIPEARAAHRVVELLKEGIALSRQTAKGLDPVEIGSEGLMQALDEFANATSKLFDVSCRFQCESPVFIRDSSVAGNLFRIAQEAVRNAINHGRAHSIAIVLSSEEDGVELRIEDDGLGINNTLRSRRGMGLTIMPRRAGAIGATFEAKPRQPRGTVVRSFLPGTRLNAA